MKTARERFWAKVQTHPFDCWLWTGSGTGAGYGRLTNDEGRRVPAHRLACEWFGQAIPDGFQVDHLCRNPACVNPAHLEPVTPQENVLRSRGLAAINAKKTHCKHGHAFTDQNTYRRPWDLNQRVCRTCHRRFLKEYAARKKAARGAAK